MIKERSKEEEFTHLMTIEELMKYLEEIKQRKPRKVGIWSKY